MPAPTSIAARPGQHRQVLLIAALVSMLLVTVAGVRPVAASTATSMASSIITWVNDARAARGLARLAVRGDLNTLATGRAAKLATLGVLSHEAAGCLPCQLDARGIAWHLWGEALASSSYPWGNEAANSMFNALKGSPSHWDLLMDTGFDQVGAGVVRAADGSSYLSIVAIDGDPLPAATPKPTPRPTAVPAGTTAPAGSGRTRPTAPPDRYVALRTALRSALDGRLGHLRADVATTRIGTPGWRDTIRA